MKSPGFDEEHRALDHQLAEVEYFAERRAFAQAGKRFGELEQALERHMREEDDVLFPWFVDHTGDPEGVVAILTGQHRRLRLAMEAVNGALTEHDFARFSSSVKVLSTLLGAHHHSEERLLHQKLEAMLEQNGEQRPPPG